MPFDDKFLTSPLPIIKDFILWSTHHGWILLLLYRLWKKW
jgi:hypothetical protein